MKKMIALLLAAMMVLSMAACASKTAETAAPADTAEPAAAETAAAADSDLAYIQDKGTLVIGITDFEPMDYKDADGSWIGFDADMAKAFAESLGVTAEFVEIDWDNKILELDSKTIDCVWNGMTLTAEVTSTMECSNAYCNNAQVVIVPADKASEYQTVESVKDLTFAAEAGSAGEAELTALGYTVTPVKAQSDALMEVAAGTSDAAVIDSLMAAAMVGEGTGYAEEYGEPITFKHIDMLVNAMGVRSYNPLQEQLEGLDCKVVVVGDASSTKNGYKNIREGFNAGNAI